MNIEKFETVIAACRFCFMCRHLSPTGLVSGREADTPRGRALIADRVRMNPEALKNADFVNCIYDSDLSAANRFHCDSYHAGTGYDETGLQLALRRDIVAAGLAPEKVQAVARDLQGTESWSISGKADTLYFVDPSTAARPAVAKAFKKVADKAKVKFATLTGGCIGKALGVLGFEKESREAMKKFADFVNQSGAKTLIVSNPAAFEALTVDFKAAKVKLNAKVELAAAFLADLAKAKKIAFSKDKKSGSFIASDYLKNYLKTDAADKLLKAMNLPVPPTAGLSDLPAGGYPGMFGTNPEESFSCGEGALVLDRLNPELVAKLAAHAAEEPEAKGKVYCASAYTANVLNRAGVKAITLEEAAGEFVC